MHPILQNEILAEQNVRRSNAEMAKALRECADYLSCIPESAAGGDDEALRICKRAYAVLAKAES